MVRRWLYKMKLFLKGVVSGEKLGGIEVDLKGETQLVAYLLGLDVKREANEQIGNWCLSDLKGEVDLIRESGLVDSFMPLDFDCRAWSSESAADGELARPAAIVEEGILHLYIEKNITL